MKRLLLMLSLFGVRLIAEHGPRADFGALRSPVLFAGDASTAYRDRAAMLHDGWFRLFFTLVKIEPDQRVYDDSALLQSEGTRSKTRRVPAHSFPLGQ